MWPFRNREAPVPAPDRACSANRPNRREWLGTMGALPVLGIVSASSSGAESDEKVDAVTQPTFVARSDKDEYARLRNLDLSDPKVVGCEKGVRTIYCTKNSSDPFFPFLRRS